MKKIAKNYNIKNQIYKIIKKNISIFKIIIIKYSFFKKFYFKINYIKIIIINKFHKLIIIKIYINSKFAIFSKTRIKNFFNKVFIK